MRSLLGTKMSKTTHLNHHSSKKVGNTENSINLWLFKQKKNQNWEFAEQLSVYWRQAIYLSGDLVFREVALPTGLFGSTVEYQTQRNTVPIHFSGHQLIGDRLWVDSKLHQNGEVAASNSSSLFHCFVKLLSYWEAFSHPRFGLK